MRKLSKICESAWGDMMRRGTGEDIRVEDDINHMDTEAFVDYIYSKYNLLDLNAIEFDSDYIYMPIICDDETDSNFLFGIEGFDSGNKSIYITITSLKGIRNRYPKFMLAIEDTFNIDIRMVHKELDLCRVYMYPKNGGKITNEYFIEVLEFFMKTIDDLSKDYIHLQKVIKKK